MVAVAALAEQVKLDDGTTCTIIESTSTPGNGTSTSVTAGRGGVSSSTTVGGQTATSSSGGAAASSSASSGSAGGQAFSTASATRPDGSVITRRSDGTCDITKPAK
ncbi:hypothetical protein M0654_22110 [Rhizobium sp. NTR19]|uniref:Uncharacterized protein n=2 Tax=Rhizobium/Agrobacterium group TaxID=227290 RepID=A0ABT0IXQ1_9HYPH|nr:MULTISPECIES: hypothetical protein [Neorhizobium]MCK8782666.1 hypothetical protein [Neorhizobium turbinariae]